MWLAAALILSAIQDGRESDRYPQRLKPHFRYETGWLVAPSYSFLIYDDLASDLYEAGQLFQIEASAYGEYLGWYWAYGGFLAYANANNSGLDAGPPIGTFDANLDTYMAGALGRVGNGGLPGFHFGLTLGLGVTIMNEQIEADNGSVDRTTDEAGFLIRGGLFIDRDLINNEEIGLLIGLTFDYFWSGVHDRFDESITFWSLGFRIALVFRPGVIKDDELPEWWHRR
jgi:hypothetical protein